MALLVDLLRHAEDPAYADAAASSGGSGRPRSGHRPSRVLRAAVLLVAVGLVTGTAASAVRASSADRAPQRAQLAAEVRRRTSESDALARRAAALRSEVTARRAAALDGTEATRLAQLEVASATSAVQGPGVVATLDDRPPDAGGQGADGTLTRGARTAAGRVLDRDLQGLVNGLWAAGAEAVSINDLRLTARTAIRSAGQAVLVDYRPLSPPYVVRAIGRPGRLEPSFADGPEGRRLETYAGLYALRYDLHASGDLHLPAGAVPEPRAAVPGPVR